MLCRRSRAALAIGIGWLGGAGCERPPARNVAAAAPVVQLPAVADGELRSPEVFAAYADTVLRSRALFVEASRVMMHPRCVNCHPNGDVPLQAEGSLHDPPVLRGADDRGVVGMECTSCHQDQNLELSRVPGAPNWHLAPLSMAWAGRDLTSLCEQLKDPARNGGKTLSQIVDHSTHDALVAWGWAPGGGREPAPGSQPQFGALVAAWVETGAECPPLDGSSAAALSAQTEQP